MIYIDNVLDVNNLKVVFASLCGALAYTLSQQNFDKKKQPFIFTVSFIMGILGADSTLSMIADFIPVTFTGEKPIGAFICSSLVVTLIIKVIAQLNDATIKKK